MTMPPLRLSAAMLAAATFLGAPIAHAYSYLGAAWPSGSGRIKMTLQLDATAPTGTSLPLTDGSTTWNSVAQSAMTEWNAVLVRSTFDSTTSTSKTAKLGDATNNLLFASTIYGSAFDSLTLAVTLVDHYDSADGFPTVKTTESDLIVNSNLSWNSYRGSIRQNPIDLRRVVLHELGHVLGLDHPDQATPKQNVSAIMNSTVSNLETLQTDDKNGAVSLYGTTLVVPTISTQPTSQSASVGGSAAFNVAINGATPADPSPLLGYTWYFKATGASKYEKLFTVKTANLPIGSTQLLDAGSYYLEVMTPDTTVNTNTVTLTVNAVATTSDTALTNLSTRGIAGSGSSTMIVGFVVKGSKSKQVLLRAVGPTLGLAPFSIGGTLGDPKLVLLDSAQATVATSATIWDAGTDAATLRDTMSRNGAFPLQAGSKDAVISTTLKPGNYTAQVTSPSGASGVVLMEAYDADPTPRDPTSRLANLSTRGYVGTGSNVMIAGFVVTGPGPHTYLIRVASTTLATNYGVTGILPDPILTLFDSKSATLRVDDDWDSPTSAQPALNTAFTQVGAFSFPYPSTGTDGIRDDSAMQSAMLVTLQPGNYTAQVSGNPNDGTTSPTGNALIEIYELP